MKTLPHHPILIKNELKILEGKNKRNIWILSLIIAVAFIGLGHSLGGLKHLKKRMDNPFTKWVNLPVSKNEYENSAQLQREFEEKSLKDSFFLDNIKGYKRDFYTIADKSGKKTFQCIARTIDPQEQLLEEIIKPSNLVFAGFQSIDEINAPNECWVIIKQEALEKIGLGKQGGAFDKIEIRNKYGSIDNVEIEFSHYVPLIAVVNDLPDLVDMVVPEHFNELFFLPKTENLFLNTSETNKIEFLAKNELNKEELEPLINTDSLYVEDVSTESFSLYDSTYFIHEVYLSGALTIEEKLQLVKTLTIPGKRPYTSYNCDGEARTVEDAYYLAFNFYDLSRVRAFRDKVKRDYTLDISLNQVEDKENFSMVARLTTILSALLFILSISSVLLFLGNLLLSHIEKISPNLGTFKAFGLSDENLLRDYDTIIQKFLFNSILRSVLIVGCYNIIMHFINGQFYLFDWKVIVALIFIVLLVKIMVNKVVVNRLKSSPGDLIYNR